MSAPCVSPRPNVVLICADQWRGDCLSIDRHPVVHTPYLDQLALRGVRFGRAYSSCPSCIAARAAIFTGLSPARHGRVGYRDAVPWNYPVTLAGLFTDAGYQTQAVGKMHVYPERSQLGFQNVILHDGFLHYGRRRDRDYGTVDDYTPWLREQLGRDADYFEHGVNCNSVVARPWDKDEYLHPTNWVTTQSIDFLRRRDPRKPFFLFLSYHRPHPPYDPPAWAFEMYRDRPMPPRPVGDWEAAFADHARPDDPECAVGPIRPDVLQRALAGYYGHMTHIDHQVNRFLELLQDHRLHENTWVCFTSDHGELLGDHHFFRKSMPFEGSARVPMILRGPRDAGLRAGAVRREVAELRDVLPTLLDAAGLPAPEGLDGRSLLPLARGEPSAWRSHIHGEHTALGQSVQWLTDGREKYAWYSGTGMEQLFDLEADPEEKRDLARVATHAARVRHWRDVLVSELAGREEGFTDGARLIPGRPVRAVLSKVMSAST
jgi:arylsulfatase A-like enzyme